MRLVVLVALASVGCGSAVAPDASADADADASADTGPVLCNTMQRPEDATPGDDAFVVLVCRPGERCCETGGAAGWFCSVPDAMPGEYCR